MFFHRTASNTIFAIILIVIQYTIRGARNFKSEDGKLYHNLESLSWMWREKMSNPCKSSWNFSAQCNSWCLFITFCKIIKSLCLAGASSFLVANAWKAEKYSSARVKENFSYHLYSLFLQSLISLSVFISCHYAC